MIKLTEKKFNFKKYLNLKVLHPSRTSSSHILSIISKNYCLKLKNMLNCFLNHSVILNYNTKNRISLFSHP